MKLKITIAISYKKKVEIMINSYSTYKWLLKVNEDFSLLLNIIYANFFSVFTSFL